MSAPESPLAQDAIAAAAKPVLVDPFARIDPAAWLAPDVVVKAGAYIPAGVRIDSGSRVGPNVVFVEASDECMPGTRVGQGVVIGANSTLHAGLTLGDHAVVRSGSVVTRSVPRDAIVEGHPAAIVGYVSVDAPADGMTRRGPLGTPPEQTPTAVAGVSIHRLPLVRDLRGDLSSGEFGRQVPFEPRRWYVVFGVPNAQVRTEHALRRCEQFLVCVRGHCAVVVDDGQHRTEVRLDAPNVGLYLPPMTWAVRHRHSDDAVLLVFASHPYDPEDYVRDYAAYVAERSASEGPRDAAG